MYENNNLVPIKPNLEYASVLMDIYSGKSSELSEVLQYLYHSRNYAAFSLGLAQDVEEIAMDDLQHLLLLGDVIKKLGGNPEYKSNATNTDKYWCSNVLTYNHELCEMLKSDMMLKKNCIDKYRMYINKISDNYLKGFLNNILQEEIMHYNILEDHYGEHCYADVEGAKTNSEHSTKNKLDNYRDNFEYSESDGFEAYNDDIDYIPDNRVSSGGINCDCPLMRKVRQYEENARYPMENLDNIADLDNARYPMENVESARYPMENLENVADEYYEDYPNNIPPLDDTYRKSIFCEKDTHFISENREPTYDCEFDCDCGCDDMYENNISPYTEFPPNVMPNEDIPVRYRASRPRYRSRRMY